MGELRSGTASEAGLDEVRLGLIRKRAQEWVDEDIHPSLVLLVARHGVIALHEAFGTFGPEPDALPLTTDAIFPLMSQSKPMTATCIMTLAEEGLVGLTRPVQDYLPEFVGAGKDAVCVHHLMTHTSGIVDVDYLDVLGQLGPAVVASVYSQAPPTQHPWAEGFLRIAYGWPLKTRPGERMSYCSINYMLLGEIVRRVSGQSLDEFARQRIFDPLGMSSTSFGLPEDRVDRAVRRSFDRHPRGAGLASVLLGEGRTPPSALGGGGGGWSTAYDTAVFTQLFVNGGVYGGRRILSPHSAHLMTTNQIPGVPAELFGEEHEDGSWGLGWSVQGIAKWTRWPVLPVGSITHGGAGMVIAWADPGTGVLAVYFAVVNRWRGPLPTDEVDCADVFANLVHASVEE